MGLMIGSKEFMSVTILIIAVFGWLTLIISLWLKKRLGLKGCLIIILKAFGKQLSYLVWIAILVICCGDHLRFFLISYIVFNLLTLLGLGMCIVIWHVKKFIIQIPLIWEILSVFGLTEISDPKLSNILFYEDWFDKGILYINDLFNPPLPGSKLFEELFLYFDISHHDRRKYNFLMKGIPSLWLDGPNSNDPDIFDDITANLLDVQKVPKFTYSVFTKTSIPVNRIAFWDNIADTDDHEDTDWEELIHGSVHFTLKFSTKQLLSTIFYLKLTGRILLIVIFVKITQNQSFIFLWMWIYVIPIWDELLKFVHDKHDIDFSLSNFAKIFGIYQDSVLTYLFLCVKYYIYICKFQNKKPNFISFEVFVKVNRETEHSIARKRDKLSAHYKKWRFDL